MKEWREQNSEVSNAIESAVLSKIKPSKDEPGKLDELRTRALIDERINELLSEKVDRAKGEVRTELKDQFEEYVEERVAAI